jgi:hypothetical protein
MVSDLSDGAGAFGEVAVDLVGIFAQEQARFDLRVDRVIVTASDHQHGERETDDEERARSANKWHPIDPER